jgi:hypothetical protein
VIQLEPLNRSIYPDAAAAITTSPTSSIVATRGFWAWERFRIRDRHDLRRAGGGDTQASGPKLDDRDLLRGVQPVCLRPCAGRSGATLDTGIR